MVEEQRYKYTIRKGNLVIAQTSCVHLAKSKAEEHNAQLWRNLPDRSYMVTDYAVPPGEGPGE